MAFGNIIFGGVIGAVVDVAASAAYDYPPMITVLMGEKASIDAPPVDNTKAAEPQAMAGTVSAVAASTQAAEIKP